MPPRRHRLMLCAAFVACLGALVADARAQDVLSRRGNAAPELVAGSSIQTYQLLALSPDNRFFAVPAGNAVDVWDIEKARRVRSLTGLKGTVSALAFSRDGRQIAAASSAIKEAEISVWEVESGHLNSSFRSSVPTRYSVAPFVTINSLTFSADARQVIVGGIFGSKLTGRSWETEAARTIEVATGTMVRSYKYGDASNQTSMDVSPDRTLLAIGSFDGTIRIFNSNNGKLLRSFRAKSFGTVASLSFSPDGQLLAASVNDFKRNKSSIEIWNAGSGTELHAFQEDGMAGIAWSPDGSSLATRAAETLSIWNVRSGNRDKELRTIGAGGPIVQYHGNAGSLFATGASGLVRIDTRTMEIVKSYGVSPVTHIVTGTSPANREVLIESQEKPCGFYTLDTMTGSIQRSAEKIEFPEKCPTLVASADGKKFAGLVWQGSNAAGDSLNSLVYLDLSKGPSFKSLANVTKADSVSMSDDGKTLAVQHNESILVIDAGSGAVTRSLQEPKHYAGTFALSPDGRKLVSSDSIGIYPQDGSIYVWDLASGHTSKVLQKGRFVDEQMPRDRILFSPDGSSFVGTETSRSHYSVDHWSATGPRLIRRFALPDNVTTMWGLAFHPDGSKILVGSWDGRLRLWDLASGTLVRTFAGHDTPIFQLKFAAHGDRIVSSGGEAIKIWNTANGDLLATIYLTSGGEWLEITPEGFFDASNGGAEMLNIVRGLESLSIDQFYDALHRPDLLREKLAGDPNGKVREAAARLDLGKALASGSPPQVSITAPSPSSTVESEQITVEATVTDRGGGIGKVEWRVNGTTLGVEQMAPEAAQIGRPVSLQRRLTLEPEQNLIEVVAYNQQGLIASEPARITISLQGQASKVPPRLYLVAVGINEYSDSRLRLAFAAPDARAVAEAMMKGGHGLYESTEVITLLDGQATAAQIGQTLTDLSRKVRPRDVFVLFMAGHGKTVDGRFYFIPQDFRYSGEASVASGGIGQDRLQQWLGQIAARKSLLLFDACESGSLTEDKVARRGMEEMTAIDRLTRAMGRSVLTATTDDKPAMEGIQGHGVFTYTLLKALAEAQPDSDGLIDIMELASYVDRRVPEISYRAFNVRQVPQTKIVGSNFPISNRVVVSFPEERQPAAISTVATHVVIRPATVHQSASREAPAVLDLAPGTQVRLLETAEGWVLVARNGSQIGYVEASVLATMQ